jgi:hypothetical protein
LKAEVRAGNRHWPDPDWGVAQAVELNGMRKVRLIISLMEALMLTFCFMVNFSGAILGTKPILFLNQFFNAIISIFNLPFLFILKLIFI